MATTKSQEQQSLNTEQQRVNGTLQTKLCRDDVCGRSDQACAHHLPSHNNDIIPEMILTHCPLEKCNIAIVSTLVLSQLSISTVMTKTSQCFHSPPLALDCRTHHSFSHSSSQWRSQPKRMRCICCAVLSHHCLLACTVRQHRGFG